MAGMYAYVSSEHEAPHEGEEQHDDERDRPAAPPSLQAIDH